MNLCDESHDIRHDPLSLCVKNLAINFAHSDHAFGKVADNGILVLRRGIIDHNPLVSNVFLLLKNNVLGDCKYDPLVKEMSSLGL